MHSRPRHEPSKYAQPSALVPRGLRIEQAAQYSGLSPFHIEEEIRAGRLLSIGGPGSGVCAAHVILKEHLDKFLDDLAEAAKRTPRHGQGKKSAFQSVPFRKRKSGEAMMNLPRRC